MSASSKFGKNTLRGLARDPAFHCRRSGAKDACASRFPNREFAYRLKGYRTCSTQFLPKNLQRDEKIYRTNWPFDLSMDGMLADNRETWFIRYAGRLSQGNQLYVSSA